MIYAIRILIVVVVVELLVGGVLLVRTAYRTVPPMPEVELNDPRIMPQLRELARKAEYGGAEEWTHLGEALLGKGFYPHAEHAFREALRHDSQHLPAQFGLAFSLDRTGRIPESSAEYRTALKLHASSPEEQMTKYHARYALGRNALREEKPEEAESLFRESVGYPPADYQVAKLLIRSGRAEEALPIIRRNLENTPYSLGFHSLDYRAQQALGRPQAAFEAAAMVERSAYLVSMNFNTEYVAPLDAHVGISPKLRELGDAVEAGDYRRVEKIATEIKAVLRDRPVFVERMVDEQLVDVAVRNGQPERVLELVDAMRKTGREDAVTLEHEADARQMLGQPERAAELWHRALNLSPSVRLHQKLAEYYGARDPVERDRHLSRAALRSGIREYRSNRLAEAVPLLEEAIRLNPRDPDPWYYLGEMHFHLGGLERAREAYRKAVELQPGHGRAVAKLANLADANSGR